MEEGKFNLLMAATVMCHCIPGLTLSDLDSFPVGVALPVLDCIRRCREAPPSSWSAAVYDMIGRGDIAMTLGSTGLLTTPTLEVRGDKDGMNLDLEVGPLPHNELVLLSLCGGVCAGAETSLSSRSASEGGEEVAAVSRTCSCVYSSTA